MTQLTVDRGLVMPYGCINWVTIGSGNDLAGLTAPSRYLNQQFQYSELWKLNFWNYGLNFLGPMV